MADLAEQRVCDRAALRQPVVIVPTEGEAVDGMLVNVSLGGMLVELAQGADGFERGQDIELQLMPRSSERSYRCKVMRAGDGMIGLSIDRKLAARFGLDLTREMFSRSRPASGSPAISRGN